MRRLEEEIRSAPACQGTSAFGGARLSSTLVLLTLATVALAVSLVYGAAGRQRPASPELLPAQVDEPIAAIGHGAFFDQQGRQIVPTAEFVAKAQSWYRSKLLAGLNAKQRKELTAFERKLSAGVNLDGQARLVVQQRALDWLIEHSPPTAELGDIQAKLNALSHRLKWRLASRDDREELLSLEPYELNPALEQKLDRPEFRPRGGGAMAFLATTNSGQDYIDECAAAGVPIPPSIGVLDPSGTAGWRSLGFIPTGEQFIVGTPAEVRVFKGATGMCIALPRYTDSSKTDVFLDGVICLSRTTSKVCFWDNQMEGNGFTFPAGTQIPIGVPNLAVNPAGQYQAGGAEIEFGTGGVCTDCHAGENPYIIHPNSDLGGGLRMGRLNRPPLSLPTFGPDRYDPIVGSSWPQNRLSHSETLVPAVCSVCHTLGGPGGRFPHLSSEIKTFYCNTVLEQAITDTMPPSSPGSEADNPEVVAFKKWCDAPANTGPSNRGDPHITTTNGVNYDFQAAGEFVALRNSDTRFELQTRQTPVLTSFAPGPNPYTGLASCVSLNTAAALRVGGHRLSYQPGPGDAQPMELRIDGRLVGLPAGGIDLGNGNRIVTADERAGLDIRSEDGTRVIITPEFWAAEGYWYLNIEVLNTPAREGTMGHILGSDWLPLAPDGASFGPAPGSLIDRHALLNQVFADAWRVTDTTSLFDYEPGTSTETFTERAWPPPSGSACTTIASNPWPGGRPRQPVDPMQSGEAEGLCQPILQILQDRAAYESCVFDVTATGNAAMADAYQRTLKARTTP